MKYMEPMSDSEDQRVMPSSMKQLQEVEEMEVEELEVEELKGKHKMICGNKSISLLQHICGVCGTQYSTKNDLLSHLNKNHTEFLSKCPYCPLVFSDNDECEQHQLLCVTVVGQRSRVSDFSIYTRLDCSVVLGKLPYRSDCNQGFISKFSYDKHQQRHLKQQYEDRLYLCSGCRQSFPNSDLCLKHGSVCDML